MLSAFIWSERSYPAMPLAGQPVHQRFVQPGPLVLGSTLFKSPTPTADRDRTVSRRSEPRSRTALMGEQPNPWDLLQPQDATIRHRGAKPPRRCGYLRSTRSLDYTFTSFEGAACYERDRFALESAARSSRAPCTKSLQGNVTRRAG
jgi:hypothetical protein